MHFIQTRAFDYHSRAEDPLHRVVTTTDDLNRMVDTLRCQHWIAFDTETSGLEWYKHSRMCGAAFSYRIDQHAFQNYYVPFRHQTGERQIPEDLALRAVREVLECERVGKVMYNAKFDRHMARVDGIEVRGPVRDTMLEANLYDENTLLALKHRAIVDLGNPSAGVYEALLDVELKRLAKEARLGIREYKSRFGYAHLPITLCGVYACYDVEFTLQLAEFYERKGVLLDYADTYQREIALQEALIEMEANGLPVDVDYLGYLKRVTEEAVDRLEPQIHTAAGYKFNVGSDEQLRHILTTQFGIQLRKRTRSGALSVDKEVLEEHVSAHPAMPLILEWRQAEKIRSTYTDSILERIGTDGLVHGDLKQVGTNTGRLSSAKPNLQNFAGDSNDRAVAYSGKGLEDGGVDPWSVKRAFVNRGPGWARGYYDYSQIELRVLAHYSRDPVMMDVYMNNGDIHHRTQMEVFNDEAKHRRRAAKVLNFGLAYCLSAGGFARQAKMPMDEAEHFMGVFFERYPRIAPFRQELWTYMRSNGCMFTNMFGRPRRIPGLKSQDGYQRGRSERQAIGSLIQGTAAELTKISIIRLYRWNKEHGLGLKLCSTVHDEIQIDQPAETFMPVARSIKHIMEDFPQFHPLVPETDCEVSTTNWAEKKGVKL